MRPWQAPIPQRDCSLASRQPLNWRTFPRVTSSQRQSSVDSCARDLSSARKGKSCRHGRTKAMPRFSSAEQRLRFRLIPRSPHNRRFVLREPTVGSADPRRFAGAINVGYAGGLPIVHPDEVFRQVAAQGQRQFDIRNQPEAASEQITFFGPGRAAIRKPYALDAGIALGADRPHSATVRNAPTSRIAIWPPARLCLSEAAD